LTEITPTLPFQATFLICDSLPGYVLRITIDKSNNVHQTADKSVYVRKGAQSLPVSDAQRITELGYAKGSVSYEDTVIDGCIAEDVVESKAIIDFLKDFSPKSDPLEYAIKENVLDRQTWKPKVSGLLLFAENPHALIPRKSSVKIARYETREDDPERDHLKETRTIEGPLYNVINNAVENVIEILSGISIWTVDGIGKANYPSETLWEIVVNAVIHRDYSISDDVQIFIFDDRVEVQSPGRLPGFVTVENILESRYSRNPKLVRSLSRYKNPPNKDIGEGMNTAFQKMKEWKLKEPIVENHENYVKVIISHTPLAQPSELILQFIKQNGQITNKQARDITGIRSENLVKIEFYKLRDADYIEMIPELKGPKAAWRLK
ncbi:transcriptional regulator, partial [bacterium]|nr:transcriptional regulator [bacterium]